MLEEDSVACDYSHCETETKPEILCSYGGENADCSLLCSTAM
jgi:hypothetical protein